MNNLRREREARNWSKMELSRRAQMANSTVGAIESGRLRPYDGQLRKLASALGWKDDPARLLEEVSSGD